MLKSGSDLCREGYYMPETDQLFDVLILLARPGAGKSEIIHFLKQFDPATRKKLFHIGNLNEIDDFPMLWAWFEEDAILERMGYPRLHTDLDGYFSRNYLWDLLIRRIGLEWEKGVRDGYISKNGYTSIVEFSRGTQHGGFIQAFNHLNTVLLQRAAILYINVSWEESLRKNRKRFNPDKPDSILEHGLPDSKLEFLYKESDWDELAGKGVEDGYFNIQGVRVPFAVMKNEDDVTTQGGKLLWARLEPVIKRLWERYEYHPGYPE